MFKQYLTGMGFLVSTLMGLCCYDGSAGLAFAEPYTAIMADKVIDPEKGTVMYELPAMSGENVLLYVVYPKNDRESVAQVSFSMDAEKDADSEYTYYLLSEEQEKISVVFWYLKNQAQEERWSVGKISVDKDLAGHTLDNPYSLTVKSKAGYEIVFDFYLLRGQMYVHPYPRINPWDRQPQRVITVQ